MRVSKFAHFIGRRDMVSLSQRDRTSLGMSEIPPMKFQNLHWCISYNHMKLSLSLPSVVNVPLRLARSPQPGEGHNVEGVSV
jgi:hypothetical protein